MKNETKQCQNCKKDFIIEPDDFAFYEKIKVPAPTFCPECRLIRRLSMRNERSLYKRACDLCKKEVISTYSSDKKLKTYCPECYKSDGWDPLDYGRDYDFDKSLFEQLNTLFRDVPRPTLKVKNSVNCEYSEDIVSSKNCYFVFGGYLAEDCLYSYAPVLSKNCVDVTVAYKSEKIYEVTDCNGLYNTLFARLSDDTMDSAFIVDCDGCTNCFGSTNLRRSKYYIFNKPYVKQDYQKERAKWDLGSYKSLTEAKSKFEEIYYATPRRYATIVNAPNSTGDYIVNGKNCQYCFSVIDGAENLKYVQLAGLATKDSYDVWGGAVQTQLAYENVGGLAVENGAFSNRLHNTLDARYSDSCFNCAHIFGCAGLKSKEYCIFNKQYAKKEYEELLMKIIEQAKKVPYKDRAGREYRFGEYLPTEFSPFDYNESLAQEKFPLTKEEALEKKYPWHTAEVRNYHATLKTENIPDHINQIQDSIINEIIECAHRGQCEQKCSGAFKIIPQELRFYQRIGVALPRLCPNCRHAERERNRNPWKLYQRNCHCAGTQSENNLYTNTNKHFHGNAHCPNSFLTPYSPNRKEIVYCENCYKAEFL